MSAFFGSMVGRVFLILVGGILATAALTTFIANSERRELFTHIRSRHAVDRLEQFIRIIEEVPAEARGRVIAAAGRGEYRIEASDTPAQQGEAAPDIEDALAKRFGTARHFRARRVECASPAHDGAEHRLPAFAAPLPFRPAGPPPHSHDRCLALSLTIKDGTQLNVSWQNRRENRDEPPGEPPRAPWLGLLLVFAACLGLLAYIVARMTTRPLERLADAATELGRDINRPPLLESGSTEVRHAAAAFNAMQAQLRRYIQERTQMLAAITHDLQTPLTRIRLRLEKVGDPELQTRLREDLSAVQGMIRDGLDLARSMNSEETRQRIDLDSLLDSVCADATDAGQQVTLSGHTGAAVTAQPGALQRCLTNLIDNAVKYGERAEVSATLADARVIVRIRDHGPGIPEAMLEKVFEPFFRLEGSRSRDTGGTGIGLTIARNIVEKHGGTLCLRNLPHGGLEAVLELPTD
ncbi:MAG: HAMP domain-containing protein [Sulfuricella sp.]|nr:HAMP domain-containing protein [Sulfuricella sp.]